MKSDGFCSKHSFANEGQYKYNKHKSNSEPRGDPYPRSHQNREKTNQGEKVKKH
jgi:hypothetical protein